MITKEDLENQIKNSTTYQNGLKELTPEQIKSTNEYVEKIVNSFYNNVITHLQKNTE